jgi:hypothetical protein
MSWVYILSLEVMIGHGVIGSIGLLIAYCSLILGMNTNNSNRNLESA